MKRGIFIIIAFVLSRHNIYAQKIELNNSVGDYITKSTPQAYQFQKYGDMPVDINTGTAQVSVPFFSLSIKGVDWKLGLSYQTSGIRVSEVSGSAGLGWNLNATGMISSRIFQLSDVLTDNAGDNISNRKTFNLSTSSGNPTVGVCQYINSTDKEFVSNLIYQKQNNVYGLNNIPDIFYLNSGQINAKFFLKNHKGYCMPSQDIDIQHIIGGANGVGYWIVKDKQGNSYTYEDGGGNASETTWENSGDFEGSGGFPYAYDNFNPVFLLKKIENPFGEVINFFYTKHFYTYRSPDKDVYYYYPNNGMYCTSSGASGFAPLEHKKVYNYVCESRLDSIVTSTGEKASFAYSTRSDLTGSYKLDAITQYYLAGGMYQFVKSFRLNNSYFGTGSVAKELRLKLGSIDQLDVSGNAIQVYQFTYNAENLPSRISPAQDSSGFSNGQLANINLVPHYGGNRGYSLHHTKACVLEKINYPTGGYTSFEYELKQSGGLRIRSTSDYDKPNSTPYLKTYEYNNLYGASPLHYTKDITSYNYVCLSAYQPKYEYACGYSANYSESIQSFLDLYNGDATERYRTVTEYNGANGTNGKTVYSFAMLGLRVGMMGNEDLLTGKKTYTWTGASYDLVSDETKEYMTLDETENSGTFFNDATNSREVRTWGLDFDIQKEEMSTVDRDCGPGWSMSWCYPAIYWQTSMRFVSSPILIKSELSLKYPSLGLGLLQQTKTYTYNPNTVLDPITIKESNSKGDSTKQTFSYAPAYQNITSPALLSVGIKHLNDLHIFHPVEHSMYKKSSGSTVYELLWSQLTSYKPTMPVPAKVYVFQSSSGVTDFTALSVSGGAVVNDLRYEERVSFDGYTVNGNITDQYKTNDIRHGYLYGYRGTYPIAEIVNAKSNEIDFNGFEEAGTWPGITALDATKPHTGKYSARIDNAGPGERVAHSAKLLTIALTTPTKFRYSGWFYSSGPSAELFLFMKRAGETGYFSYVDAIETYEIGKWVYVEKEFTVPADVVQLGLRIDNNSAGTVWYDDIRLHPSASLMTTYTYDALIGITSQCDINNRITYYSYDAFGRLQLVKDHDGKILKKFCYNYAGQAEDCGVNVTPAWTATGNLRCATSGGNNTGYQEREERDNNPNSTTYNQTQWVSNGYNTTSCPLPAPPCSISISSGYSMLTSGISSSSATVSFYIVFNPFSTMQPGNSYYVATVNGGCRPSTIRTISYSSSGRTWSITIYPNGQMYWYLAPGSTSVGVGTTIGTGTLTYNL